MSSERPKHQAKPKRRPRALPGKIHMAEDFDAPIEEVFGRLKRDDQPSVSIEEIGEAIQKGWAGER